MAPLWCRSSRMRFALRVAVRFVLLPFAKPTTASEPQRQAKTDTRDSTDQVNENRTGGGEGPGSTCCCSVHSTVLGPASAFLSSGKEGEALKKQLLSNSIKNASTAFERDASPRREQRSGRLLAEPHGARLRHGVFFCGGRLARMTDRPSPGGYTLVRRIFGSECPTCARVLLLSHEYLDGN